MMLVSFYNNHNQKIANKVVETEFQLKALLMGYAEVIADGDSLRFEGKVSRPEDGE